MVGFAQKARCVAKQCAGIRVRQVSRLLTGIYNECLRPLGIQETQFSVLVAVATFGEGGAMMSVLAEKLVLDRTTLTRNIVPLEKAGYLRVARSADDARTRVILLTRSGERLIESAYPLWEQAQGKIRRALGDERFEALRSQLTEVVALADELEVATAAE